MSGDLMREALELADAALSGANMNMAVVRRKISEALAQAEQRGEVVASVEDSLTVRAAFENWLAWWSNLPSDRGEHGYRDMTVDMLSYAYAAGMMRGAQVGERGEVVPIKQFRVKDAAAWNDGIPPTHHYETRTVYTATPAPSGTVTGWFMRDGRTIYTIATASGPIIEMVRADEAPVVPDDVAKDAARWRFCESHPGWLRQVRKGKAMWFAFASPTTNYEYDIYPTAREAIDAAMLAAPEVPR